jgi:hypothetical protein
MYYVDSLTALHFPRRDAMEESEEEEKACFAVQLTQRTLSGL